MILEITLRNKILGNNNLLKVTRTKNKVWSIFDLKGIRNYKKKKKRKKKKKSSTSLFSLYYEIRHIKNPGIFIICGICRTL